LKLEALAALSGESQNGDGQKAPQAKEESAGAEDKSEDAGTPESGQPAAEPLHHPVFFLGQSSWVLSRNVFYNIDLSPLHRLFQFFDAHGQMTVKLEIVPKFLAVDLPILTKRMDVRLDEAAAPFPVAITEPPQVVIRLSERKPSGAQAVSHANPVQLEVSL